MHGSCEEKYPLCLDVSLSDNLIYCLQKIHFTPLLLDRKYQCVEI